MIHRFLENTNVVLASGSDRRRFLLQMMGIKPLVLPSSYAETPNGLPPARQVIAHASAKAHAVQPDVAPDCLIIGADTIVVVDKTILGKPRNPAEAKEFLRLLSGRNHWVYTGICLLYKDHVATGYRRTRVTFDSLTDSDIEEYVATEEPMDKAGAYGIQGFGAQFITDIKGCYFNVMGFPLNLFYQLCREVMA